MLNNSVTFDTTVGPNGFFANIPGATDIPRMYNDAVFQCQYLPFHPLLDPSKYEEFPDISAWGVPSFGVVDYVGDIAQLPIWRHMFEAPRDYYFIVAGSLYNRSTYHQNLMLNEFGPYQGTTLVSEWDTIKSRKFGEFRELELCVYSCFRVIPRVPATRGFVDNLYR